MSHIIDKLIMMLEKQRIRLYELYIDIVDLDLASRIHQESLQLEQAIDVLRRLKKTLNS